MYSALLEGGLQLARKLVIFENPPHPRLIDEIMVVIFT